MTPKTRQRLEFAMKCLQDEGFDMILILRDLKPVPSGESPVEVVCLSKSQYHVPEMAAVMLRELAGETNSQSPLPN